MTFLPCFTRFILGTSFPDEDEEFAPPQLRDMKGKGRMVHYMVKDDIILTHKPCNVPIRFDRDANPNKHFHLLNLPKELQFMIFEYLDFGHIEKVRRTCRFAHDTINRQYLNYLYPNPKLAMLSTCCICLEHDPSRRSIIRAPETNPMYPFASKCVTCTAEKKGFMVGEKVMLGDWHTSWVCRFCGYPVHSQPRGSNEFHSSCMWSYHQVVFGFFIFGIVQWVVQLVASALCWHYFKTWVPVLVPMVVNSLVAMWTLALTITRTAQHRTYHWSFLMESTMMGLWLCTLKNVTSQTDILIRGSIKANAVSAFLFINIIFRGINLVGNTILMCELKLWRRYRPRLGILGRVFWNVVTGFAFCVYPQCVEQAYPGRWWFRK